VVNRRKFLGLRAVTEDLKDDLEGLIDVAAADKPTIRWYDHEQKFVVNIKAYNWPDAHKVAKDFRCSASQAQRAINWAVDSHTRVFFDDVEQLANETFKRHDVKIEQHGRSGGWLSVEGLPPLEDWDGQLYLEWSEFEHGVKASLNYYTSEACVYETIAANDWAKDDEPVEEAKWSAADHARPSLTGQQIAELADKLYVWLQEFGVEEDEVVNNPDGDIENRLVIMAQAFEPLTHADLYDVRRVVKAAIKKFTSTRERDENEFLDDLKAMQNQHESRARHIVEADGDVPDLTHPSTRRKLSAFKNNAVPDQHAGTAAKAAYTDAYNKLAHYTGLRPTRVQDAFHQVGHRMMQALSQVSRLERGHERELEKAAIDTVLALPEFTAAKEAYESGDLKLKVSLTSQIDLRGASVEAEDLTPEEERHIEQVVKETDEEVQKRRFINMMIQGNAGSKLYAYHMAQETLDKIDPRLLKLYGELTSTGHFFYWLMPDEAHAAAHAASAGGEDAGQAGAVRVGVDNNGKTLITVQGRTFPILVHELTKGLMEFLSYSEDSDDDTRRRVSAAADTLNHEPMDLRIGPAIWQQISDQIGAQHAKLMPYVYDRMIHLPTGEFNQLMRGLLSKDPAAKTKLDRLITDEKRQHESLGVEGLI